MDDNRSPTPPIDWASALNDDLPHFTHIEAGPTVTEAEMEAMFAPDNPLLAAAEKACRTGDLIQTSAMIDQLVQEEGLELEKLTTCLSFAVKGGQTGIAKKLLRLGVRVHSHDGRIAVERKSLELMALLLDYGWDVADIHPCSLGPLAEAVREDADSSVVEWLLSHGADPDRSCNIDTTPLSVAVEYAPRSIVELLFHHTPHPQHGQLLHHAAKRRTKDCVEVMEMVMERFGSRNRRVEVNKIMYADDAFSYEMYKIIGLGTPLHEVARCGRSETVRVLLECGVDVKALDSRGNTAMWVAELAGNRAVVDELLRGQAREKL